VFFPSAAPLRAVIKDREAQTTWMADQGYASMADAIGVTSVVDARMPWVERHPLLLRAAVVTATTPVRVKDSTGRSLPISPGFRDRFRLLAVTGGEPAPLFGEWDGSSLRPLTVWGEAGAVSLQ
jgi:hypothetical protein